MKRICLLDFDGTITQQDTLVVLLNDLVGQAKWEPIEEEIRAGRMTNIEGLRKEMNLCQIAREEFVKLLQEKITIHSDFKKFLRFCEDQKIEVLILSGGFAECIEAVFSKYGLQVPYFANELIFGKAFLDVRYPYEKHTCGNCSHCKAFHVKRFKRRGYETIFVGNGTTDRCPAKIADRVFARDSLAKFCDENKLSYQPFQNFTDIQNAL